jgi:hypothetical protein
MIDFLLTRIEHDALATRGELHYLPAPGFLAHTLELPWRDNARCLSCIPTGTYPLRLRDEGGFAQRYGHAMVEIVVPDRSFILFHRGNYHRDTKGCILVGNSYGYDTVGDGAPTVWNSTKTYNEIYPALRHAAESCGTLTVQ